MGESLVPLLKSIVPLLTCTLEDFLGSNEGKKFEGRRYEVESFRVISNLWGIASDDPSMRLDMHEDSFKSRLPKGTAFVFNYTIQYTEHPQREEVLMTGTAYIPSKE